MKKYITLLIALFFLVVNGACVTAMVNKDVKKDVIDTRVFEEEVSSFLITQDGKQLIVVGKDRHYIFEPNDTLKFILTWSEKKHVKAAFHRFNIDQSQQVHGGYVLNVEVNNDLSVAARNQLLANGFRYNTSKTTLTYQDYLNGKCYSSNNVSIPKELKFNQTYKISIEESYHSGSATAKGLLLTPLAVIADGVLVCAGIPLFLLGITLGLPTMAVGAAIAH